eukprot:4820526-Prymnesium_polylepis.1
MLGLWSQEVWMCGVTDARTFLLLIPQAIVLSTLVSFGFKLQDQMTAKEEGRRSLTHMLFDR